MISKSLIGSLLGGFGNHHHGKHASEYRQEHQQEHVIPEHLHKIKYKHLKKREWHLPHPFKFLKDYASWG